MHSIISSRLVVRYATDCGLNRHRSGLTQPRVGTGALRELFHAFPMKFTSSAERWNGSPRLFVADKRSDSSLLIGSGPARPHSAFDVLGNYAVRYRVFAKESKASMYDCFVFLGRALHAIVGSEFWKIGARDNNREAATAVEYRNALRIFAKRLNRTAVRSDGGIRF